MALSLSPKLISPVVVKPVSVPRLVMLGCAAVASVPVIDVLAVRVVNVPAAGVAPPITVLSIVPPSMSGVFTSGLVSVLFVKVCVPVSVATVESILTVTVLPEPTVSKPVPPAIVRLS